jgi:hypothetical protein
MKTKTNIVKIIIAALVCMTVILSIGVRLTAQTQAPAGCTSKNDLGPGFTSSGGTDSRCYYCKVVSQVLNADSSITTNFQSEYATVSVNDCMGTTDMTKSCAIVTNNSPSQGQCQSVTVPKRTGTRR